MTFESFCEFSKTWMKTFFIELFINGNFSHDQAKALTLNIERILSKNAKPLATKGLPSTRIIDLKPKEHTICGNLLFFIEFKSNYSYTIDSAYGSRIWIRSRRTR